MVPKMVASWVWGHAPPENRADDRANSKHALEIRFVAAERLPTITAPTYFCIRYTAPSPPPSSRLGRLFCRALVQPEFLGHFHQICDRVGLHFLRHLASVCLDCFLADAELATDLFSRLALAQEAEMRELRDLRVTYSSRN